MKTINKTLSNNYYLLITIYCLLNTFNSYSQGSSYALDFDGANDYIEITDQTSLRMNDTCTLSAWVYIGSTPGLEYIVRKWISSDGGWGSYSLYLTSGGKIAGNVQNASLGQFPSWKTANSLTLNKWHHVAFVYSKGNFNATDAKIYVNGMLQTTTFDPSSGGYTSTFSIEYSSRALYLAKKPNNFGNYFDGNIDEVRIWNKALTQTEIQTNMCKKLTGTETGLVAYYPMNEGIDNTCSGGEDVCDMSGNGNNGTKF